MDIKNVLVFKGILLLGILIFICVCLGQTEEVDLSSFSNTSFDIVKYDSINGFSVYNRYGRDDYEQYGRESEEIKSRFGIGLRYNYFKPKLDVKNDLLKPYYADMYTPIPSASYVASYTDLEWDEETMSNFMLDLKFSPSRSWNFIFWYETFKDMEAVILGAGEFTTLNVGFADIDIITLEKIKLMTLGANYTFMIDPTEPFVKLNLGLGLQQIKYKATDEGAGMIWDTATGAIDSFGEWSETDSVSEIKPTFWFGLDVYPTDNVSINLLLRSLDLSSDIKWGTEKTKIIFKGTSLGLGATVYF